MSILSKLILNCFIFMFGIKIRKNMHDIIQIGGPSKNTSLSKICYNLWVFMRKNHHWKILPICVQ